MGLMNQLNAIVWGPHIVSIPWSPAKNEPFQNHPSDPPPPFFAAMMVPSWWPGLLETTRSFFWKCNCRWYTNISYGSSMKASASIRIFWVLCPASQFPTCWCNILPSMKCLDLTCRHPVCLFEAWCRNRPRYILRSKKKRYKIVSFGCFSRYPALKEG